MPIDVTNAPIEAKAIFALVALTRRGAPKAHVTPIPTAIKAVTLLMGLVEKNAKDCSAVPTGP